MYQQRIVNHDEYGLHVVILFVFHCAIVPPHGAAIANLKPPLYATQTGAFGGSSGKDKAVVSAS